MSTADFFDYVREEPFGGKLTQLQVNGLNDLIEAMAPYNLLTAERAYILATAYHETAHTMQPIEEYGKGKGKKYGQPAGPYDQKYYGRGYVQLTWLENYQRASSELKVDFVKNPALAMENPYAARILITGMLEGWFTGKKLSDYINDDITNYVEARRIVNGTDRAELIAGYAKHFEEALNLIPVVHPEPAPDPAPTPKPKPEPPRDMHSLTLECALLVTAAALASSIHQKTDDPEKAAAAIKIYEEAAKLLRD